MLERSTELRLGGRGDAQWRNDDRSLPAMLGDILVDRRWNQGGGRSRCLLIGEERSAQLEVEEGRRRRRRVVRREGREGRSVHGRKTGFVWLFSQIYTGRRC